jgi:two-component system, LytTR family, sensor kinase
MYKRGITILLFVASIISYGQKTVNITELLQKLETVKDSNKVKLLFDIGNYYLGMSRIDSNKYYLAKALEEAKKCNYEHGRSRALTGLGYMHKAEGEYDKAIELFLEALHIKEELKLPLEAAALKDAMGRVYIDLEKPEKAFEYYTTAKKVYESFKDSARLVSLMNEIAGYYATKKVYDTAIQIYEKVLKVYNNWEINKSTVLAPRFLANYRSNALTNYSYCLIETGRAKEAIVILEPLYEERKKIGGGSRVVLQSYLAYAYLRAGDHKRAAENCEEAIGFLNSNPDLKLLDELKDLNRNASEAYYALGDYKKAYEANRTFKEINDSIINERSNKAIAEMQTKYETEIKDDQITQLNREKRSQRLIIGLAIGAALIALGFLAFAYRAKKLQQKLFHQKEELMLKDKEIELGILRNKMTELEQMALQAQMNPHFIFNSLNSVQHYVMNKDVEGVNKYLGAFANLIRQTLNNSGRQFVSMDEEVKYLDSYLSLEKMKSNNKFNYAIFINENVDRFTTFIPGMILQPFVENSIRHGVTHKEKNDGQINISISKNGKLICLVEDNGIGRKKAAEIKSTGDEAAYESKGMAITMNRIETINKIYHTDISLQVDDVKDSEGKPAGTRVKLEFPPDME